MFLRELFLNNTQISSNAFSAVAPQVAQAHYERSAYINLFHFAYIMITAKYKSLYEKCSKYVLIAINAK